MKRITVALVIINLCVVGVLGQSRRNRRRAAVATEAAIITIHQIDFRNYTLPLNGKSYRLIDGFYAETIAPNPQWGLEIADGPFLGDLTGDKKEEAAFVLRYGPVGAPNAAEARVYTLRNGKTVLLATFQIAEAVDCQLINYIKVEDGMITIERIHGTGARCDYNEMTQYRWNGSDFVQVGEAKKMPCRCV